MPCMASSNMAAIDAATGAAVGSETCSQGPSRRGPTRKDSDGDLAGATGLADISQRESGTGHAPIWQAAPRAVTARAHPAEYVHPAARPQWFGNGGARTRRGAMKCLNEARSSVVIARPDRR